MIPPVPEALFENKTVLGTGCDSCKKLQAKVKRLEGLIQEGCDTWYRDVGWGYRDVGWDSFQRWIKKAEQALKGK